MHICCYANQHCTNFLVWICARVWTFGAELVRCVHDLNWNTSYTVSVDFIIQKFVIVNICMFWTWIKLWKNLLLVYIEISKVLCCWLLYKIESLMSCKLHQLIICYIVSFKTVFPFSISSKSEWNLHLPDNCTLISSTEITNITQWRW